MAVYCSNEYCKGRHECAKAQGMKDGDKVECFINGFYVNRCPEFEALPKVNTNNDHHTY